LNVQTQSQSVSSWGCNRSVESANLFGLIWRFLYW